MKYFGTDGIRFKVNEDFNPKLLIDIGKALSTLNNKEVLIGSDTRISKDLCLSAISTGVLFKGLNINYVGIISTPGLMYISKENKMTGVMITASHNPFFYNGIKIFNKGYKLTQEEEELIEKYLIEDNDFLFSSGEFKYQNQYISSYYVFLEKQITKCNLRIALDCANGSLSNIAPYIYNKVTDKLFIIANKPDGYNINSNCGSTNIQTLKKFVLTNKCDIGFAFDGDGDRVIAVLDDGTILDGDLIIYLLACYFKKENILKNNTVVLSIMSNLGIIKALKKRRINVIESNVGDKYIYHEIVKNNLSLGGENSGHIILNDLFHSGDGLLVSLMIIRILSEGEMKIMDYLNKINLYADSLVNIRVSDKEKVINNIPLQNKIKEIKEELKNDCKIIVRKSGTEDLIRVTVMAKNEEIVLKYSDILTKMISNI